MGPPSLSILRPIYSLLTPLLYPTVYCALISSMSFLPYCIWKKLFIWLYGSRQSLSSLQWSPHSGSFRVPVPAHPAPICTPLPPRPSCHYTAPTLRLAVSAVGRICKLRWDSHRNSVYYGVIEGRACHPQGDIQAVSVRSVLCLFSYLPSFICVLCRVIPSFQPG
jgi:hypothetical protein